MLAGGFRVFGVLGLGCRLCSSRLPPSFQITRSPRTDSFPMLWSTARAWLGFRVTIKYQSYQKCCYKANGLGLYGLKAGHRVLGCRTSSPVPHIGAWAATDIAKAMAQKGSVEKVHLTKNRALNIMSQYDIYIYIHVYIHIYIHTHKHSFIVKLHNLKGT